MGSTIEKYTGDFTVKLMPEAQCSLASRVKNKNGTLHIEHGNVIPTSQGFEISVGGHTSHLRYEDVKTINTLSGEILWSN